MTEEEWVTAVDPHEMVYSWPKNSNSGESLSTRKLYLIAVAVCRTIQHLFQHDWHRLALVAAEEIADAPSQEDSVRVALRELHEESGLPSHPHNPEIDYAAWGTAIPHEMWEAVAGVLTNVRRALDAARHESQPFQPQPASLIRDIVGNPFRPVTFDPSWRTSTASALARQMYDSRDFAIMPILADALQDAGCDNDDILSHCRDPQGTHVRGCWVVDLVLGKS
jgi:hypothetical protein